MTGDQAAGTSAASTCSAGSLAAAESLVGTATQARDWLVVERRGSWGRDAIADTEFPEHVKAGLEAFPGRVLLARRPDRRTGEAVVFRAHTTDDGGTIERRFLRDPDALASAREADGGDDGGDRLDAPLVLVCAHGRRDACCGRLGVPVFDAFQPHIAAERLWQSSHHGGHRFAANVLALPAGVQLGRVSPGDAGRVAELLASGRIPLDLYRGRTLYPAHVQAAEAEIRRRHRLDRIGALRLEGDDGHRVTFAHPGGATTVTVEESPGPVISVSCGQEPERTVAYSVRW